MATDITVVSVPSDSTIHALLRLLSDPNQQVAQKIQDQLVQFGPDVFPFLDQAVTQDASLESRVTYVKEEIHFGRVKNEFQQFVAQGARQDDWEQGAFLVAKMAYPDLSIAYYVECLDRLADEFREKWYATDAPNGKAARLLSIFLFKDKGFSGNRAHYYDPDNSYLNRVIETRQGIPISLSALYTFVGRRLDLPVVGVGMPGHFLVKIEGEQPTQFVDCFNGGTLLGEQDCQKFIAASGFDYHPTLLEKSTTPAIVTRMLRNLLSIYEQENEKHMARRVRIFLELLENELLNP